MSAAATPAYEWKAIPWAKVERTVYKLQTRIHRASKRGDRPAVRRLQRLLIASRAAKLLAVRRVTQDNRGKRTAGIDGVKSLRPNQRIKLASTLTIGGKVKPTRRVWIPKPGTDEKRPLGIPVMQDRAAQALLKLGLEPEWEAQFEPNSYGFRPGYAAHDAIAQLFNVTAQSTKYVLDADIAKCFDRISHSALLQKLNTTPTFRRAIRAWLKAGVVDDGTLFPTDEGAPQGGIISPLLMNVALHGLETAINKAFHARRKTKHQTLRIPARVVRYADDFVVLHAELAVVEGAKQVATDWLAGMGLELKPSKTRIVHTLHEHAGQPPGFDFLGFNVRSIPCGRTHANRNNRGESTGTVTLIKPSKANRKQHVKSMSRIIREGVSRPQAEVISRLNPVIRGWSNYFSTVVSGRIFSAQDHYLFTRLYRWAKRRHPRKHSGWISSRYWHRKGPRQWTFKAGDVTLANHVDAKIRRHVKIQAGRSYFDGDWSYWGTRMRRHPMLTRLEAFLLNQQGGRCAWCKLSFMPRDITEIDHVLPASLGGSSRWSNRQLLHGHCHDQKTATDGSTTRKVVLT
jgi:RNA-directed DNA polymerase